MGHVPGFDQVLDDLRVGHDRVGPDPLRDRREMVEQVGVLAVEHVAAGHGDDPLEHRPKGQDRRLGLAIHHLADDPRVERLVPRLVAGDLPADPGQVLVTLLGGEPGDIAVGDPGRTLLERGIDEGRSGVAPVPRVESVGQRGDGSSARRPACPPGR